MSEFTSVEADQDIPSIYIEGVDFFYGEDEGHRQVLFGCDLTMYPGEMITLTGPSGAGKTTLLTLIGTLRTLETGSLKVLGKELNGMRTTEQVLTRRSIGFIFQEHNLIESLTVADNVRLAMQLKDHYTVDDFKRLPGEMLQELGLGEYTQVKPQKLSTGQRQRVAIARALINRPPIILADEPTAALDRDNARQVIQYLYHLATKQGCTVVIVTHDNRIMNAATRIVSMVDGRIDEDRLNEHPEFADMSE